MAGHGSEEYRDYFSSSSPVTSFPAAAANATDATDADMALPSQAALGSQRSFPDQRVHMETLDLNSHGEGFSFVDSYSSYLQQGVPHLGPSGDGGRIAAFQPPRPINTRAGSDRGRSLAMRGRRSRAVNNGAGSSSQPWVNAPGKKELFNYAHSSLRNVIERSFGVLKMKWRILRDLPSYSMAKQSQIIIACMALLNFIRGSAMRDEHFDNAEDDENYFASLETSSSQGNVGNTQHGDEDHNMNQFRDWIADGLFNMM